MALQATKSHCLTIVIFQRRLLRVFISLIQVLNRKIRGVGAKEIDRFARPLWSGTSDKPHFWFAGEDFALLTWTTKEWKSLIADLLCVLLISVAVYTKRIRKGLTERSIRHSLLLDSNDRAARGRQLRTPPVLLRARRNRRTETDSAGSYPLRVQWHLRIPEGATVCFVLRGSPLLEPLRMCWYLGGLLFFPDGTYTYLEVIYQLRS